MPSETSVVNDSSNNQPLTLCPCDVFWWEQEGWDHEADKADQEPLSRIYLHG